MGWELRMDERKLTLAIWQAVYLWSDSKYERFLRQNPPGQLDEIWFKAECLDMDHSKGEPNRIAARVPQRLSHRLT
jgi:hypothetical protein